VTPKEALIKSVIHCCGEVTEIPGKTGSARPSWPL
jgi:hypothetical protein